jgi:YggT family protein
VEAIVPLLVGAVAVTRTVVFGVVCVGAILCAVSWAARTRRLNPFGAAGRLARDRVDPMLAPVQRAVRRAGGTDASVPWWGLAALVLGGIIAVQVVEYLTGLVFQILAVSSGGGVTGLLRLAASLTFSLLELAILVRVVASWIPALAGSRWLRWAWTLSEPILEPLRRVLPTLGPIDISPLVALLLLQLVGGFIVGALR